VAGAAVLAGAWSVVSPAWAEPETKQPPAERPAPAAPPASGQKILIAPEGPLPKVPGTDIDDLSDGLREGCAFFNQPGIAAAVFRDTGIVAIGAAGVRELGKPERLTTSDAMHVGSVSKGMTATLVAMMVEEGKLRWEMTLAEAFPELAPKMSDGYRAVTLEQVMHHRGGVPAFTDGRAPEFAMVQQLKGDPKEQRAQFLGRLLAGQPQSKPGTQFTYSNADYAIAAGAVEAATGRRWEGLMEERVFGPLGMATAGFGWPATVAEPGAPHGHTMDGDALRAVPVDHPYRLPVALAPAGDIHCSIEDFAKYGQFHLRGILGEEDKLLRRESFAMLHKPMGEYAMGWVPARRGDHQLSWHNGSAGTFFALIQLDPESKTGVVIVTNSGTGDKACQTMSKNMMERYAPLKATKAEEAGH
jgi:CubicO group peptidase (beta-lactamase class C family)